MSTLWARHTKFESKLDQKEDIYIEIDGIPTIIEYSSHGIERSKHRSIFQAVVTMMIQNAFDELLDLKNGQKFMIIDSELGITVIGVMEPCGLDVVIPIISVIDSAEPTNPHGTYTIAV